MLKLGLSEVSSNFAAYFPFLIHTMYLPITALIGLELHFFFKQETFIENSFVCDCGFTVQSVVFQLLSYCFKKAIGFDVKASFVRLPVSHLIKPGDIIKEF